MEKIRIECRVNKKEKEVIDKAATELGLHLSDYFRRKMLDENEDLVDDKERYVSPHINKNNLLIITILLRVLHFVRELFRNQQNITQEIFEEVDKCSLEFARKERRRYGYKLIKPNDE